MEFDWENVPVMEVTGDDAALTIKQGDFDLLLQAVCVLKYLAEAHDLTEGQIEFLELVHAYSIKEPL